MFDNNDNFPAWKFTIFELILFLYFSNIFIIIIITFHRWIANRIPGIAMKKEKIIRLPWVVQIDS